MSRIEYEYTDREQELDSQSQEQGDSNEPPDKVTKWIVFAIVVGVLLGTLITHKH